MGGLVLGRRDHAGLDPHANLDRHRIDILDAAHHAETLVEIDHRHVVGIALAGAYRRRRIDGAKPLADLPFQLAAGFRRDHARIENRLAVFGHLIGKLALFTMLVKNREGGLFPDLGHSRYSHAVFRPRHDGAAVCERGDYAYCRPACHIAVSNGRQVGALRMPDVAGKLYNVGGYACAAARRVDCRNKCGNDDKHLI